MIDKFPQFFVVLRLIWYIAAFDYVLKKGIWNRLTSCAFVEKLVNRRWSHEVVGRASSVENAFVPSFWSKINLWRNSIDLATVGISNNSVSGKASNGKKIKRFLTKSKGCRDKEICYWSTM